MINIILIVIGIYLVARFINITQAASAAEFEPVKPTCPPHSWFYEKVYNEDGSIHHELLVCSKCGPLRGAREND